MRLASVIEPLSDTNLRWAAQCGVRDVVTRYPGPTVADFERVQRRIGEFGLNLGVIEGYLPLENITLGRDDGRELAAMKDLLRNMGECGVPTLCYNFMPGTDWVRTRTDAPARGGARVTAFDLAEVERAQLLGFAAPDDADDGSAEEAATRGSAAASDDPARQLTAERLWENLERLLGELVPVAEQSGVDLAMHPDDPPLSSFLGRPRILHSVEAFERLVAMCPSPRNGICFCQGTMAEAGVDIPVAIRRLGPHIKFVHFRDVRGTATRFEESFHDDGQTDMVAAMRAYRDIGFEGAIRPDHVPQLTGEEEGEPGYTMLGRLYAFGYIRGLLQATDA